jgi:hypothetical protein
MLLDFRFPISDFRLRSKANVPPWLGICVDVVGVDRRVERSMPTVLKEGFFRRWGTFTARSKDETEKGSNGSESTRVVRCRARHYTARDFSGKSAMVSCYMCDEVAVSVEHVPPRCLFPKQKDLPRGVDLRRELLTVPACAQHNMVKSREDEYFLDVIVGFEDINAVGIEHYRQQVRRQYARNNSVLQRFKSRSIDFGERLAHRVEIERLDSFIDQLARGLYFVHFGKKWHGRLDWFPEFLSRVTELNPQHERARLSTIAQAEKMFSTVHSFGANPSVFTYQVVGTEQECEMRLHFYGMVRILLTFPRPMAVPFGHFRATRRLELGV